MRGKDALWVVGTDHAGIATQIVITSSSIPYTKLYDPAFARFVAIQAIRISGVVMFIYGILAANGRAPWPPRHWPSPSS